MSQHPPRSVEQLVEHQGRRWDLERRAATPRPAPPCIALSRLPGSGGAELGQRVADKLDYGFFGIEIVDRIAREHGIGAHLLAQLDERVRSGLDRSVVDAFSNRSFTESEYLRSVVRVVTALAGQGKAVILGRGSPFVLTPEQALRVLVVASRSHRIERRARDAGLSSEEAEKRLAHEEEARRTFHRHHFDLDPDLPTHFDLVVNTGALGMDAAVSLVIEALRARFPAARRP
jgi:cytidylate kinase